nr:proton-conducting transporter membrane subunit [Flavobacterium covae]
MGTSNFVTNCYWSNGGLTSLVATFMARVQSSVKSQIAYSSISQIGLIFIEIALGLDTLALLHFAGNAFLRTYQLLVSPSVVSYLIREQFYHYEPVEHTFEDSLPKRLEYALYILSIKEFNLEKIVNLFLWKPLKFIGKFLNFLNLKRIFLLFVPIYIGGILLLKSKIHLLEQLNNRLPEFFAFIGLISVFKSFSERKSPFVAWVLIIFNHFWIVLAILFNEKVDFYEISLYLTGIIMAGILGYIALVKLSKIESKTSLNQYLGHVYEHPKYAFFFLVAALGVTGFPITTTFIGEDLLFSHIESDQVILAFFIASSFVVSGIAGVRIYTRLFLGPHVKTYHELPYKSS